MSRVHLSEEQNSQNHVRGIVPGLKQKLNGVHQNLRQSCIVRAERAVRITWKASLQMRSYYI